MSENRGQRPALRAAEGMRLLDAIVERLDEIAARVGQHEEWDPDDPDLSYCTCHVCQDYIPAIWQVWREHREDARDAALRPSTAPRACPEPAEGVAQDRLWAEPQDERDRTEEGA